MGPNITVEEIRTMSDSEILKFLPETIKNMRPRVRAIYYKRTANMKEKTLKVVVTGDVGAGKSSLMTSFLPKPSKVGGPEQ